MPEKDSAEKAARTRLRRGSLAVESGTTGARTERLAPYAGASLVVNPRSRRRRRIERSLFGTLLVLHLAPIAVLDRVATQDGPSHLTNAVLANRLISGDCPIASDYFSLQLELFPNWTAPLLLMGLTRLSPASAPELAEKLLQVIYLVALALALRRTILQIEPENEFLALAVFPLSYAYPFSMGFYAFSLGIPLLLLWVGLLVRHREHLETSAAIPLALLALLTFFTHPLPYAAGCLFLGALALAQIVASTRSARRRGATLGQTARTALPSAGVSLLALAPSLLLALLYFQGAEGSSQGVQGPGSLLSQLGGVLTQGLSLQDLLASWWLLVQNHALIAYDPWESVFATTTALVLGGSALYGLRSAVRHPTHPLRGGLALAALLFLLLFFALPDFVDWGGYIRARLLLLFWIALVLWLATLRFGQRAGLLFQAAIITCALGLLGLKAWKLREVNLYLAEYLSAAQQLEPGHTLLPLNFLPGDTRHGGGPSFLVDPLLHASGYLAVGRCLVSLNNYEADDTDHFPTRFRPELNPYTHGGYDEYRPERVDLARYAAATGRPIEYVLSWGAREAMARAAPERAQAIQSQLRAIERDYDLIHVSEESGRLRLYRRRPARSDHPETVPRP
jgi:hypothetical protein